MTMPTRLLALAAFACMGFVSPTIAGEAARSSVTLEPGTGTTVTLERPFSTVLIGNPELLDIQTQDQRSVRLRALRTGATNLVFIDKQGIVIRNLKVLVRGAQGI